MWCDAWDDGVAQGPVEAGLVDGDLGQGHRICPRTSLGLSANTYAIIELENLYGRIVAAGTLSGSWAASDEVELWLSLEAFRYDMLIAPISSSAMGLGYTDVGASWRFWDGEKASLGLQGKLVLPTAFLIDQHSWPLSGQLGLVGVYAAQDRLLLHAALSPDFGLALGGGPLYPRFGVATDLGLEWRPFHRFGFVVDGITSFGRTDVVDYLGAGLGLRGGIGEHAGLSLEARVPFYGAERALAAVDIRFEWRF